MPCTHPRHVTRRQYYIQNCTLILLFDIQLDVQLQLLDFIKLCTFIEVTNYNLRLSFLCQQQ